MSEALEIIRGQNAIHIQFYQRRLQSFFKPTPQEIGFYRKECCVLYPRQVVQEVTEIKVD
jgi:hypothetical protein